MEIKEIKVKGHQIQFECECGNVFDCIKKAMICQHDFFDNVTGAFLSQEIVFKKLERQLLVKTVE